MLIDPIPRPVGPTWRESIAAGMLHSGVVALLRRVSQNFRFEHGFWRPWTWRRVEKPGCVILCYHRIGRGGVPIYSWLDADIFEAQIRYLRRHYRIISISELAEELKRPRDKRHAIAITFDDGYRSTYLEAFPVLRKYKIPATVYLTVESVESGEVSWYDRVFLALQIADASSFKLPSHWPAPMDFSSPAARLYSAERLVRYLRGVPNRQRLEACKYLDNHISLPQSELADRMLTWEQIREMQSEGCEFGSHTLSHPVVSRLPKAEMERELRVSKQMLEQRLGLPVRHFAYPFGQPADCGDQASETLVTCGYRTAATTCSGVNGCETDLYRLMRVSVGPGGSLGVFAWRLNRLFGDGFSRRVANVPLARARVEREAWGRAEG